jgi:coatomer protein complex subunit gamma
MHLLQTAPEIVKRWSNEVQEAVQSKNPLVQAHSLALLHMIRQNDRLAVSTFGGAREGWSRKLFGQCWSCI